MYHMMDYSTGVGFGKFLFLAIKVGLAALIWLWVIKLWKEIRHKR